MIKSSRRRGAYALVAALTAMFLLASCAEDEPVETQASPTTGEADPFDIVGTVLEVDIEPVVATPTPTETRTEEGEEASPSPTATVSPTPSGPQQALILVEVESIDPATAELCEVSEGDSITLTVGEDAQVTPQREIENLEELEELTVRAEGTAEKLARVEVEEAEESPTPEEDAQAPTPEEDAQTPTSDPEATPSPTGEAGVGCHFEVAALTEVEQVDQTLTPGDDGDGAEGAGNGTPTPASGAGSPTPTRIATPTPAGKAGGESPGPSPTADY